MSERWLDVSEHQVPAAMRWPAWAATFPRGQYRLTIGARLDTAAAEHRARMRLAGMKTGSYGVPVERSSLAAVADQARLWCDHIPADDENDDWCDAERQLLTEAMLHAYCTVYDQRGRGRMNIYTGYPWWVSHVVLTGREERYAQYPLILAAYPYDTPPLDADGNPQFPPMDPQSVARRSNPPPASYVLRIPRPWVSVAGHQHTGQGSAPGYDKFLDMGQYHVNPGPIAPVLDHANAAIEELRAIVNGN